MKKLKELRKEKKITQEKLAQYLGVAQSSLAQYELGTREPSFDILKKIANFFGVSIDYLLDNTQENLPAIQEQSAQSITPEELKSLFMQTLTEPQQKIFSIVLQLNELQQLKTLSYLAGILGY